MNNFAPLSVSWENTKNSNVESFNQIHGTLEQELNRFLIRFVKDEVIAQDLLQELFICMWEKRDKLGMIINLKAYLYKCAKSLALQYLRSNPSAGTTGMDLVEIEFEFSAEQKMIDNEYGIERSRRIKAAVNGLPKRQREMISMKFFGGWEYEQISELTGIKYQSVVNHVHRGIIQLRNEMNFVHFCPPYAVRNIG